MDFIERIFGFSPDGGDGSLEALYVLGGFALLGLVASSIFSRAGRWRTHPAGGRGR